MGSWTDSLAELFPRESWIKKFAWLPVTTISGERVWLKEVYCRRVPTFVNYDDLNRYEYGTIFDVMKDN